MAFKKFNFHPGILKALEEVGYNTPTPIQESAIPMIMSGTDLRASAQTGTGKTAAFILPALQKIAENPSKSITGPRVLILVPTRELAMQVATEANKFSKFIRSKTVCLFGGTPYPIQIRELKRPYDILVATPGRLIDHLERGRINLTNLDMLVLDEADRMLDMGFIGPVEEIAAETPPTRQTLLFSATLKGAVLKLSEKLMRSPKELAVAAEQVRNDHIEQRLHHVDSLSHKNDLLNHILTQENLNQAIVFTSTKRHADELVDTLFESGIKAAALHGDMNQRQRTRTMAMLRQGKIKILVATDVAARGIDILTISHVINFDLPRNVEDYVHRIGRTGRAGTHGIALSFASHKDIEIVRRIEKFLGQKMTPHVIPGMEPKFSTKPSPNKPKRFGKEGQRRFSGKKFKSKFAKPVKT